MLSIFYILSIFLAGGGSTTGAQFNENKAENSTNITYHWQTMQLKPKKEINKFKWFKILG